MPIRAPAANCLSAERGLGAPPRIGSTRRHPETRLIARDRTASRCVRADDWNHRGL